MYNRKYTYPTDKLFEETKIHDLRQLFLTSVIIRQHKYRSNLISINHKYNTRQKTSSKVPKPKKLYTKDHFII